MGRGCRFLWTLISSNSSDLEEKKPILNDKYYQDDDDYDAHYTGRITCTFSTLNQWLV